MKTPYIETLSNPAPWGPTPGARRSIVSVHRRRRKQEVRSLIRRVKRQNEQANAAAAQQPLRMPLPKIEAPEPTENALLLKMTRDELRAEAKSRGLTNYGHLNKQGLRDLLGVQS